MARSLGAGHGAMRGRWLVLLAFWVVLCVERSGGLSVNAFVGNHVVTPWLRNAEMSLQMSSIIGRVEQVGSTRVFVPSSENRPPVADSRRTEKNTSRRPVDMPWKVHRQTHVLKNAHIRLPLLSPMTQSERKRELLKNVRSTISFQRATTHNDLSSSPSSPSSKGGITFKPRQSGSGKPPSKDPDNRSKRRPLRVLGAVDDELEVDNDPLSLETILRVTSTATHQTEELPSSITAGELLSWEDSGLLPEEMIKELYERYGLVISMPSLKRLLFRLRFGGSRKSTSSSRRRQRRFSKSISSHTQFDTRPHVLLPLDKTATVSITELARALDEGSLLIVKAVLELQGQLVSASDHISQPLAMKVVEQFGGVAVFDEDAELEAEMSRLEDPSVDVEIDSEVSQPKKQLLSKKEKRLKATKPIAVLTSVSKSPDQLSPRPAVVALLGHVDHGKTTLLDKIRHANVASHEAGGITQAVSAFTVSLPGEAESTAEVTFIDTPGHAAFRAMRARGASLTDFIILVVSAEEGVKEQTIECIKTARLVGSPIIVAITKSDSPQAFPQKVRQELAQHEIFAEDYGGDVLTVDVSARTGDGLSDLYDAILLQADMQGVGYDPNKPTAGVVLESRVMKGFGPVATTILQSGSVTKGDFVVVGGQWGRVRSLLDPSGKVISEATPGRPFQIVGLHGLPIAGDNMISVSSESEARELVSAYIGFEKSLRKTEEDKQLSTRLKQLSDTLSGTLGTVKKFPVILRTDGSGPMEVSKESLRELSVTGDENVLCVEVTSAGVGEVTTSDVELAASIGGTILAFNSAVPSAVANLARARNVPVFSSKILYELVDYLNEQMRHVALPAEANSELHGIATVQRVFSHSKATKIAGCMITSGEVHATDYVRVMRNGVCVFTGAPMASLRVGKDIVTNVPMGSECGIAVDGYSDFHEGDELHCHVALP